MKRLSVLAAALVLLACAGIARAQCTASVQKCNSVGGISGNDFFNDLVCSAATCTMPASGCDTCPGHCSASPNIECATNGQCPNGSFCQFFSTFGHCTASSPQPGKACILESACSADGQSACPGCCPNDGTPYAGDGRCVLYGSSSAQTITGTSGNDVICAIGGNDTINAGDGDDIVDGGTGNDTINGGGGRDTLYGMQGNDAIAGNTGSDFTDDGGNFIDGGADDDSNGLVGAGGDDIILGGPGNDVLIGQGGADFLKGGDGNDVLVTNYGGPVVNDVLGTILCGGPGDDEIIADGPGHQCMDAGTGQTVPAGDPDDCQYSNLPDDTDDHDVGTGRNCGHAVKTSTNGTLSTRTPSCGCD